MKTKIETPENLDDDFDEIINQKSEELELEKFNIINKYLKIDNVIEDFVIEYNIIHEKDYELALIEESNQELIFWES